jgi:hypothetical protein
VVVHLPPPVPLHRDVRHRLPLLASSLDWTSIDGVSGVHAVAEVARQGASAWEYIAARGRGASRRGYLAVRALVRAWE